MELTQEQFKEKVDMCMRQLHNPSFSYAKKWLNDRLITDELIKEFEIGYGEFFGKRWITLPIKSIKGEYLFIKLRRDPNDTNNPNKFMFYPIGSTGTIFGAEELLSNETLVICEGEYDRMLLYSRGVPAITSTLGASGFKKEWIFAFKNCKKIYIIFDKDEAGDKGAKRLGKLILEEHPSIRVFQCYLPDGVGDHGDLTDFFLKTDGNIDELLYDRSVPIIPERKEEKAVRTYNGESLGGEITDEDIQRARQTDCKNFISIARESYNNAWAHCPFGGGDHDKGNPSLCCYEGDKGFYCFSDDTEIFTEDGFLLIKDIVEKKKRINVFSLNKNNNKVEVRKINKFYKYKYEGDLINFKTKNFDILVTPNHKMVIHSDWMNKTNKNILKTKEAKDVTKHDRMTKIFEYDSKNEIEYFIIPSITRRVNQFEIYKTKKEIKIKMDNWLKFFGLWLADGWTSDSGYVINIVCGSDNFYKTRKIKEAIQGIGFDYKIYKNNSKNCFCICNIQLGNYLKDFGKAKTKFIPSYMKKMSKRQLMILFNWMYSGDGSKLYYDNKTKASRDGCFRYNTSSKRLADDFHEISIKLGYNANLSVSKDGYYKINLSNDLFSHGGSKKWINNKKYCGNVYSVEVPPNYNIMIRREGKVIWSGQSYCCGVGGDTIDLVSKLHDLDFKEAVKFILKK